MGPEEPVRAHLDLHSSEGIAIHFGTFNSAARNYEDPVNDLKAEQNNMPSLRTTF